MSGTLASPPTAPNKTENNYTRKMRKPLRFVCSIITWRYTQRTVKTFFTMNPVTMENAGKTYDKSSVKPYCNIANQHPVLSAGTQRVRKIR